jgi:2-polyprenyl-6-methoxyphenol hydroxylase-like FAD-dependent oxidoreductase
MAQHANRVIVSGCGPVGAVMALALVRKGIPTTLIEQLRDGNVLGDAVRRHARATVSIP